MLVFFGARLFGKIDRVPGVCYIATRFIHIGFVPFVPTASWLVFEKTDGKVFSSGWQGVELPSLLWRSVGLAWLRAGLMFAAVIASIVAATVCSLDSPWWEKLLALFAVGALLAGIFLSHRFSRATPARLAELKKLQGVPEDLLSRAEQVLSQRAAA